MKLGEKINIRRFERLSGDQGHIGSYLHAQKIGVLVMMEGGDEALARDIAMHVAASRPDYVSKDQVPAAAVAKAFLNIARRVCEAIVLSLKFIPDVHRLNHWGTNSFQIVPPVGPSVRGNFS